MNATNSLIKLKNFCEKRGIQGLGSLRWLEFQNFLGPLPLKHWDLARLAWISGL